MFDENDEESEELVMYKNKCDKSKIAVSMYCGKPWESTEPVPTTTTTTTTKTTTAAPCDCVVASKMLKKMGDSGAAECQSVSANGKKYSMKFYCDDDEGEFESVNTGTCRKLNKLPKTKFATKCISDEDQTCSCELQINKIVKKVNTFNGNKMAKAECDTYTAKKPTWKVYCDTNDNGEWDEWETFQEQTNKCRKFSFDTEFFCNT